MQSRGVAFGRKINFRVISQFYQYNNQEIELKTMKKQLLMQLFAVGILALSFGACASEDNAGKDNGNDNKEIKPAEGKGLRGYIDSTAWRASAPTRMTGYYMTDLTGDGSGLSGIRFFWDTDEDTNPYLYVNTGTDASPYWNSFNTMDILNKDSKNRITAATWHGTTLTKDSYKIRYGNHASSNYTEIEDDQYQYQPGQASHLRAFGDYATATAEDNGMWYDFVLKHHSAYITFMPYAGAGDSHDALASCKLLRVIISSDQTMSSTSFPVNDDGFNIVTWPTGGRNYINLVCAQRLDYPNNGSPTAQFNIPASKADAKDNGAIMVLAPGTYTNVKIKYLVWDPVVNNSHTFTTTIASLTLNPGKNKPIYSELKCKDYTSEFFNTYHMWGAKAVYWNTGIGGPYHNWKPEGNKMDDGTPSYVLPQTGQTRYYSDVNGNAKGHVDAPDGSLDADAPTANLMEAYCRMPHYWDPEPFTYDGHLFSGRMWFLKKSFIASLYGMSPEDLSTVHGTGKPTTTDYVTYDGSYSINGITATPWSTLPAAQKANYFFVLPLGGYNQSGTLVGMTSNHYNGTIAGGYWTSTARANRTDYSWVMVIKFTFNNYEMDGGTVYIENAQGFAGGLYGYRPYFGYPKWPGETLH